MFRVPTIKSALMTCAPLRELKVIRQHEAVQYTELSKRQSHSAQSPVAHFDEFIYFGQVTLPEESDQLRLHRHSATSPLGYIATRLHRHPATSPPGYIATRLHRHSAATPEAQKLTLTSSSTLDRSRYLRNQFNTSSSADGAQQLALSSSTYLHRPCSLRSQINSGYIATQLHRHSATAPEAQQLTLTSSSTLDRSRYLRS